jgi:hypothetical protein
MKGDLLIDTDSPAAVDATLQQIGAVLLGGPDDFERYKGHYIVRPLGHAGFVRFAITNQGYATLVGDAPDPAPWD